MDYNTQRRKLALPEYGRNVQQMVDHLTTIQDREERSKQARAVISIMGSMNPHLRDINDFKHKLWDHLHIMSDFKLDIDSPYPKPDIQTIQSKPDKVPYPTKPIKLKHYGRSIEQMIQKAIEMEEGPQKEALTQLIANHMKKSYLIWSNDSVSDADILHDLSELSEGKLTMAEGTKLSDSREAFKNKRKFQPRKK